MLPTVFKFIKGINLQLLASGDIGSHQKQRDYSSGISLHSDSTAIRPKTSLESTLGRMAVCLIFLYAAIILGNAYVGNPSYKQAWLLACGWISWTFFEYLLHRFLICQAGFMARFPMLAQKWSRGVYYNRFQRLNIMLLFMALLVAGCIVQTWLMYLAGLALGWLGYSYLRVLASGKQAKPAQFFAPAHARFAASSVPDTGYGWSTPFWDWLFGTLPVNR